MSGIENRDQDLVLSYLDTLQLERKLSDKTIQAYRTDLVIFFKLRKNGYNCLDELTRLDIENFIACDFSSGSGMSTVCRRLSSISGFFRWLFANGFIVQDPTLGIKKPNRIRSLPQIMSENDVESLLSTPDTNSSLGCRDRAFLELLYATGIRVSEACQVDRNALDLRAGFIRVMGKGNRERIVPLGESACYWLEIYLKKFRYLFPGSINRVIFPGRYGEYISRQAAWHRVKIIGNRAGIQCNISPHILRHAFATHLVNNGADLRAVQLLLGHKDLSTTQIYTHVARARMKMLHSMYHPRG